MVIDSTCFCFPSCLTCGRLLVPSHKCISGARTCSSITTCSALSLLGITSIYYFQQEVDNILSWVVTIGEVEGFFIFLLLFVVMSLPMTWGYVLVNIAAGYRFGFLFGMLITIICVTIGTLVAFMLSRCMLRNWLLPKLQTVYLQAVMSVVEGEEGFRVIALLRLTPIPFGLQNGVFALSRVKTSTFVMASFVGLIPTQAINSYLGCTLRSAKDYRYENMTSGYSAEFAFCQIVISIILSGYIIRLAQRRLNKTILSHRQALVSENGGLPTNHTPQNSTKGQKLFTLESTEQCIFTEKADRKEVAVTFPFNERDVL